MPSLSVYIYLLGLFFFCQIAIIWLYQNQKVRSIPQLKKNYTSDAELGNVLLIITFNHPLYDHIPLLIDLYGKVFPNIVFCGPTTSVSNYKIEKKITQYGYFSYNDCMADAMLKHRNYSGYFTMGDDVLLNYWNLKKVDLSKIWQGAQYPYKVKNNFTKDDYWMWWESSYGLKSCARALTNVYNNSQFQNYVENLKQTKNTYSAKLVRKNLSDYVCYGEQSDLFYIPLSLSNDYVQISNLFRQENVFLEIAIPTIIRLLSKEVVDLRGIYVSGSVVQDIVNKSDVLLKYYKPDLYFIHPFKLNNPKNSKAGREFLNKSFQSIKRK